MWILAFAVTMIVPICIGIYTMNFGRWLLKKESRAGALTAFVLAVLPTVLAAWVYLRGHLSMM